MSSDTPYAPPQSQPPEAKPSLLLWIAGSIFGSTVIGSGLGLVLGVVIGIVSIIVYLWYRSQRAKPRSQ